MELNQNGKRSVHLSPEEAQKSGNRGYDPPRGGPELRKKARLSRERKGVKKLKNVSFFLNMARDAMEKNFAGSELKPKGAYCALR